jgi:transposase
MGTGKDLTVGERHTIKMLKNEGMSSAKIARMIGRSATAVKNCLTRLKSTGSTNYFKREHSGRKSIIDNRFERRIIREIKADSSMRRMTKNLLATEISHRTQVPMSARTLMRAFKRKKIKSYIARRKPMISEKNRIKRLKWARTYKNWTKKDWRRVLWTDESTISTDSSGKIRVWCHRDELYNPDCTQATVKSGRTSIMVWGCVNGQDLRHLTRTSSRMNGKEYGDLILDTIYPITLVSGEGILQEDNAPIHKCKLVEELKSELGIVSMEWPPQSPDLSPIENVWKDIKNWIYKNRSPRNKSDLEEAVTAAWENIAFDKILRYIDTMPDRVKEVIKKNGYATHW